VKQILLNNTILKTKNNIIQGFSQVGPNANFGGQGPNVSKLADLFQNFSADVVNVRQTGRDETGVYCAADFELHNRPDLPTMVTVAQLMMALGIKDPSCTNDSVRYKVQPLLDKPGKIYVSWVCQ
jgi:hypothetical protein